MHSSAQLRLFNLGLDLRMAKEVKSCIEQADLAKNTIRNYRSGWKAFESWCIAAGLPTMPATPQICIDFAAWCIAEGYRLQTVKHRLKAVNFYHRRQQIALPFDKSVRSFLRKAKRHLCEGSAGKVALTPDQLRRLAGELKRRDRTMDIRDRAMILLGFAAGWRRSEIVSLDVKDVRWVKRGIVLWLGKSKTDQEGEGRMVGIQFGARRLTCPVHALKQWLAVRGRWNGPLFTSLRNNQAIGSNRLHPDKVRFALKRALEFIGEDPRPFGAHSLRIGMITAAIEAGATETSIMQRTGHRRYETLRRYVRPAQVFRANPLKGVL